MKIWFRSILLFAGIALLAGCSQIGTVNSVDVQRVTGENSNATYCQKNRTLCIIGGAAVLGGAALIIREVTKDDNKTTSQVGGGDGTSE